MMVMMICSHLHGSDLLTQSVPVRPINWEAEYQREQEGQQSTWNDKQHGLEARTPLYGQRESESCPSRVHKNHPDITWFIQTL